ncbi:MAG: proline--tRNA ligase [Mycoplasmoidaceae bacterium]|nr:MAG: proline--tRNA ligase [Mycoplasmoidaceae bacterium]
MGSTSIVKREINFADWYTSVCVAAKLFSYGTVKGTINYLPNGWKIWELMQEILDKKFKEYGAQNVQLPLFIKTSDFLKEKTHIDGFAPETFTITEMAGEKLSDPLIIRPTSEVLFSKLFQEQIHSYKDLPLKFNQWCGVYRAEKNTKPFLRGSEFFWQELHCMFENEKDAMKYVLDIHNLYDDFLKNVCYLPVLSGKKTEGEKFPGAIATYTREVFSQDGQCIQTGTSHYLGTNFPKMYDVKFQTNDNKLELPHYTSHGITTRMIGDLIVVHGDDNGLILPFELAPTQIAIATIMGNKDPKVIKAAEKLKKDLKLYRVIVDSSDDSFGFKISKQEVMGTPMTIVVGPKDLEKKQCMLIRRDNGGKVFINLLDIKKEIIKQKLEYSKCLYAKAKKHLDDSIIEIKSIDEFKKVIKDNKICLGYWGGSIEDEHKIKELTGAAPRCVKEDLINCNQKCFFTNKPAKQLVYFARAY